MTEMGAKLRERLIQFELRVSQGEYEIVALQTPPSAKHPRYYAKTMLSNDDGRITRIIRPIKDTQREGCISENDVTMARQFSQIFDPHTRELNEQKAVIFASKFGLLDADLFNNYELVDLWRDASQEFQRIFSAIDKMKHDINKLDAALILYNNSPINLRIRTKVIPDINLGRRILQIFPTNLLTAMWLLLAEELTSSMDLRLCESTGCRKWFTHRSNKKYCSVRCRVAGNRTN